MRKDAEKQKYLVTDFDNLTFFSYNHAVCNPEEKKGPI